MEASYQLLQQRVNQDIAALRAEHARQAAQQTQSLRDMLQKGIADLTTAQLTPVWTEVTALQTRVAEVDTLVAKMV